MKVLPKEGEEARIKIDKKDREILAALCRNARLPLTKIGQIVGLSRESVEYRINRLEQFHVLAGSRSVINIRKLKHFSFHVFVSLHNPEDENLLIKRCVEDKNVNALIKYSGKWDYEISIMTDSHEKFYEIYNKITNGITIQDYNILVLLNTIKSIVLPKKFLSELPEFTIKKNDFSFFKDFMKPKKNNYKIDEKDLQIMKILSSNTQIRINELAGRIKLSPDAVTYRIKKLIENSYIIEFRPVIDYSALNLSIQALLIKTASMTKEEETDMSRFLKENDSVLWATKTFGQWNYLVYVITQNQKEFHAFVDEIRKTFGKEIRNYEALFAYQEHKYNFLAEGVELT